MGRGTGKSQNEWLKDVFARLEACAVEITHQGKTYAGSLVQEFSREEESGLYRLVLNERLTNLYSAGWTAIPWERRQLLRRKPLAQWLFNYYMSHDAPYPLKVQTLLSLSGSHNSCLRDFKRKLRNALNELQSIGAIDDFEIAHDLVKVRRCR